MELANTSLSVLRGTTVNAWGDKTNVGTPLYTGIPAALVESAKQVFDRASQRMQTIRTSTCVVPDWADILDTDTLIDETSGDAYMIESVTRQPTLGPPPDKILVLRSRSGVSVESD
ncbi:MAG: hypothetical protein ACRDP7_30275 [Trebonia sp.]